MSGTAVLDQVEEFLARFVAYPSEAARVATVLWAAHTHLMGAWESTPRLAFLSPEPGSGKTRALEVLELLVPRPLHAVNATPAALFRKVSDPDGEPTILFDEIDTVFGPKAKDNEDVRGMLNAGHRRGATSLRCVVRGKTVDVEEFPAYCAVAVAGLGDLPDTILTRSVVIRMRRRAPGEFVEAFRHRVHAPDGEKIRGALASWAQSVEDGVTGAWPQMPAGVEDRAADVWEPLLAVADAAGGTWPERARVSAVTHVTQSREGPQTLGVTLMRDLYLLKIKEGEGQQYQTTEAMLAWLHTLDESPWADLRGAPLDARGLARRLRPYGIAPRVFRDGERTARGYAWGDFLDPWSRYLPSPTPQEHVTAVTGATVEGASTCTACGFPLDPVISACGQSTHPACDAA